MCTTVQREKWIGQVAKRRISTKAKDAQLWFGFCDRTEHDPERVLLKMKREIGITKQSGI